MKCTTAIAVLVLVNALCTSEAGMVVRVKPSSRYEEHARRVLVREDARLLAEETLLTEEARLLKAERSLTEDVRLLKTLHAINEHRTNTGDALCDLEQVDKSTLHVPVSNVAAPWTSPDVLVWNSSRTTQLANDILDSQVECMPDGIVLRDVFRSFENHGCWMFMFGGIVRDMILGRTPKDVDVESSCSAAELREVCELTYPGYCWPHDAPIMHIGGSEDTETYLDVATWDQTMMHRGLYLEYTANALAYEWSQHAIVDLSGRGAPDSCKTTIRIPVEHDQWDAWVNQIVHGKRFEKSFRYWKLRAKGFTGVDEDTAHYVKNRVDHLTKTDSQELQKEYCKYVWNGKYKDGACEAPSCATETTSHFDSVLIEDFGRDYWSSVLEPLFHKSMSCVEKTAKSCKPQTDVVARVNMADANTSSSTTSPARSSSAPVTSGRSSVASSSTAPVTSVRSSSAAPVTSGRSSVASSSAAPVTSVRSSSAAPVTSVRSSSAAPVTSVRSSSAAPVTSVPSSSAAPVTSVPSSSAAPATSGPSSVPPSTTGVPVTSPRTQESTSFPANQTTAGASTPATSAATNPSQPTGSAGSTPATSSIRPPTTSTRTPPRTTSSPATKVLPTIYGLIPFFVALRFGM